MDDYDLVPSGLINLIKKHFNTGVDQAGADIGQPTVFFVGCALNLNPTNMEQEAKRLWRKVQAGADYILTQPVYESALVGRFLTYYEKTFEKLDIPLLLGILPLVNVRHAAFLQHEVPGIEIPLDIMKLMNEAGESGYQTGIEIAIQLIGQVKKEIQGVFIVPAFNRFNDVAEIIEAIRS
jgi:homocysteine S-methyltransferase